MKISLQTIQLHPKKLYCSILYYVLFYVLEKKVSQDILLWLYSHCTMYYSVKDEMASRHYSTIQIQMLTYFE